MEQFSQPPPVFLSYQWGHQEHVKTLKEHLSQSGFEAWMDISKGF